MSSVSGNSLNLTPHVIAGQLSDNILSDEAQIAQVQQQISTGHRINRPSDDPAGTADVLRLTNSLARAQQYQANATAGLGWLSQGTSTLDQVLNVLQTVQMVVQSASGANITSSPAAMAGLAAQVTAAQRELLDLANTQYGNQAVFAGTGNVTQAFDAAGNYVGGGAAPTVTVAPGTRVQVSVTGPAVFGSGASGLLGAGGILAQIAADLQTATAASVANATTTGLGALQAAIGNIQTQAAVLGANYQQMQNFVGQATDTAAALQTQLAGEQNTNLVEASTQLSSLQDSYQAALWSASKIEQVSLVRFLS